MRVRNIGECRKAYTSAKKSFIPTLDPNEDSSTFWENFGRTNNIKIIINSWVGAFPVIDELEFVDEKAYIWFLLKWS